MKKFDFDMVLDRVSTCYRRDMYGKHIVDPDDLRQVIGQGAYGTVCRGELGDGTNIAIKFFTRMDAEFNF